MPESLTDWVLIYLVSGGVLLASIRLYNDFFKKKDDKTNWVKDVLDSLEDSKPKSISARQVIKVFLFVMLVLMVWPFAIAVAIKEVFFPAKNEVRLKPEDYFTCKKSHLIKKVIPQEIEKQAVVIDPKGRAPQVPFGHLHPGWINLLSQLEQEDALWAFKKPGQKPPKVDDKASIQWSVPRGEVSGYAVVRNGKVKAEFLTEWD
jgi:hypothetical protein